jgi:uncharacterized Zn ribbon protein
MGCDCDGECPDCKCKKSEEPEEKFTTEFIYRCPHCGEWLPEWVHTQTYDEKTDTVICSGCSFVLKVGDGIAGSDTENPGDMEGALFFICPGCHSSISEEHMVRLSDEEPDNKDAAGVFICPVCKFHGRHDGGLQ